MVKKLFLTTILIFLFFLNAPQALASRPPSNACYVKGEVVNFENPRAGVYKMNLKIMDSDCGVLPTHDNSTPFQINEVVDVRWLPNNTTYSKLGPDEVNVFENRAFLKDYDKNKILSNGAIIKAIIDSWDYRISYANLVQESADNSNKALYENKTIHENNNVSRISLYLIILLIAFIALLGYIALILFKKNKK